VRHFWNNPTVLAVLVVAVPVDLPGQSAAPGLVPLPALIEWGDGRVALPREVPVVRQLPDPADGARVAHQAERVLGRAGLVASAGDPGSDGVVLVLGLASAGPAESYRLEVTPDTIAIFGADPAGVFHGISTLGQLIVVEADGAASVPLVTIEDQPRFRYRGMHLDVGRHFFPVAFIKRYIDLLALFKFNTFHWHLTEDQGWRLAIDAYPRLTGVGSCRRETMVAKNFDPYVGDGTPYCGFYSQDDIREVVAYAADRYVTVIPEIEMPGHSLAALAAYPAFACTPGPFEVGTRWGVYPDIYCPTEATFAFLEEVLSEVMALFPSPYIHIGGDEAPKDRWRDSPAAQDVIRREGLADEHELQSYFIRRIERFLNAHGRRLIGWDEILEGGVAPDATVMSWRGMAGGIEAARQGHDVIMTPGSHVYFDHYQGDPRFEPLAIGGFTPLAKVYAFEPVPEELSPEEAAHVIGAQANVWTEYITTPAHVEYMALPRMVALSEVLWSPIEARSWDSFRTRLPARLRALDRLGVAYRVPEVEGLADDRLSLDPIYTLSLSSLIPNATIRYTLDGTDPSTTGTIYRGPLRLRLEDDSVMVTARAFLPDGRPSPAQSAVIRRTALRPAEAVDSTTLEEGLRVRYSEGRLRSLDGLDDLVVASQGVAMTIALTGKERPEEFALRFDGFLVVDQDGVYQFEVTSDDGSRLWIGDTLVVDHDGLHSARAKRGTVALATGRHRLRFEYFQAGGGSALTVAMRPDGTDAWRSLEGRLAHGP
jgi:hexosaminidase